MLADLLHAATALVDGLTTLDGWAVLLVTFASSALETIFLLGLLVPGESVVMLSASLHGPAGFALAVTAGTTGALTGQIIGYAVGRAFGSRLRTTRLGRRIGAARFDRAEQYLHDRGAPALVAVRFVAVVHAVVPIVAGVARMPFGRFLAWSALGTALWVGTFAGVGAATASADSTGGVGVVLTAIAATGLGIVPIAIRFIRRFLRGRAASFPAAPGRLTTARTRSTATVGRLVAGAGRPAVAIRATGRMRTAARRPAIDSGRTIPAARHPALTSGRTFPVPAARQWLPTAPSRPPIARPTPPGATGRTGAAVRRPAVTADRPAGPVGFDAGVADVLAASAGFPVQGADPRTGTVSRLVPRTDRHAGTSARSTARSGRRSRQPPVGLRVSPNAPREPSVAARRPPIIPWGLLVAPRRVAFRPSRRRFE